MKGYQIRWTRKRLAVSRTGMTGIFRDPNGDPWRTQIYGDAYALAAQLSKVMTKYDFVVEPVV
jgi:hypothetical protein